MRRGQVRCSVDQPQHAQPETREDGKRVRRACERHELGAYAAARRRARSLARRDQAGCGQHKQHGGCEQERAGPTEPVGGHQHESGSQHTDAIQADPDAVGKPELVLLEILDRVAVDRDIVRRRQCGKRADRHPDHGAKPRLHREVQHRATHGDIHGGHPAAVMPPVINRRSPEELERPCKAEQRKCADLAQLDALLAEVNRKDLVEDAERETFGEVEQADPEKLVREERLGRGEGIARVAGIGHRAILKGLTTEPMSLQSADEISGGPRRRGPGVWRLRPAHSCVPKAINRELAPQVRQQRHRLPAREHDAILHHAPALSEERVEIGDRAQVDVWRVVPLIGQG